MPGEDSIPGGLPDRTRRHRLKATDRTLQARPMQKLDQGPQPEFAGLLADTVVMSFIAITPSCSVLS